MYKKLFVKSRVFAGALVTVGLLCGASGVASAAPAVHHGSDGIEVTSDFVEAAQDFQTGDAGETAELALSAADMVDGDETIESGDIGGEQSLMSVDGADEVVVVGGSEVYVGVDTDVDMVHQATGAGERFIAVLGSEDAPSEQAYDVDIPEGARLVLQVDGSIDIVATTTHEVVVPGEEERIEREVAAVFGKDTASFGDVENATDEQIERLADITPEQTETVTVTEVIGEVEVPWAVDAEGNKLEPTTKYTAILSFRLLSLTRTPPTQSSQTQPSHGGSKKQFLA